MTEDALLIFAEDDDEDWILIEDALNQCPQVHWERVKDGEELLKRLRRDPLPHMIMLDLRMPRRDGFWALDQIRKSKRLRGVPITIMTTSTRESDVVGSYSGGANAYMTKPPSFQDMAAVLAKAHEFWTHVARVPRRETSVA